MTWYFIEADEDTISIFDVVADVEVAWESFGNSWVIADSLAKACLHFFHSLEWACYKMVWGVSVFGKTTKTKIGASFFDHFQNLKSKAKKTALGFYNTHLFPQKHF